MIRLFCRSRDHRIAVRAPVRDVHRGAEGRRRSREWQNLRGKFLQFPPEPGAQSLAPGRVFSLRSPRRLSIVRERSQPQDRADWVKIGLPSYAQKQKVSVYQPAGPRSHSCRVQTSIQTRRSNPDVFQTLTFKFELTPRRKSIASSRLFGFSPPSL
jgi:hypothetical protein